eukprot:s177_g40.t1
MATNQGALGWTARRSAALWELIRADFADLHIVAGREQVPASRLLLAAACPALAPALKASPQALHWEVSPEVARAIVAFSCGLPSPFAGLSAEDGRIARCLLRTGSPKAGGNGTRDVTPTGYMSWLLLFAVCVASLTAYWPLREFNLEQGGFFMDDAMIRRNTVVVDSVFDLRKLWRTDYWGLEMFDPDTWTHKSFRPLTVLTFRWNYLWHGFNSSGFHVTNGLLHGLCALQLALWANRVLRLPVTWAGLLAALFAVHPVHSESICYVVGRADILCAQVLLVALHFYSSVAGRGPTRSSSVAYGTVAVLLSCGLIVASGLCKETGFTFFGLLVIWEVLHLTRSACRNSVSFLRIALLLLLGASACACRVWYTAGTQIARMDPYSNPIAGVEDPLVRAMSYSLVHGMYIKLLLWPLFLCYDYSMDAVPLVESLTDARLLLPLSAYLAFVLASCHALQRFRCAKGSAATGRAEGAILGLAMFLLSFLPMTNILFPIGTLVAERLLYIPSLGFLLLLVCFLRDLAGGSAFRRQRVAVIWMASLGLVGFWWWLCHSRVSDWKTVEQITLVDGLKQLRSSRTQFNLANLYLQSQRMDEALVAYRRSIAADPLERDAQPLYHAGQILMYRGQYEEAQVYLHKAVTGYFSPLTLHEEEVWHDYGLVLWHVGRHMEAAHNFQNAIITNPNFPKGHNNLACALVMLGLSNQPVNTQLVQQGLQAAEQAITLAPHVPLYWRNAAVLLSLAGEQSALAAWERFRQYDPKTAAMEEVNGIPRDCTWEFYFR